MKQFFYTILAVCLFYSCTGNKTQSDTSGYVSADSLFQLQDEAIKNVDSYSEMIIIRHAKGLAVEYDGDSIHITITNPDPAAKDSPSEQITIAKNGGKDKRFICTTALQLGNFEILGLEKRIVGMNSLRNLFSPRMKEQMKSGETVMIGKEGNFDLETVIAARPDYIFVSASKHGGFEALKECGIPLISHHGYKETDPLGQAEWIKLVGLLTGEPRLANAVFTDIEEKYLKLQAEVADIFYQNDSTWSLIPAVASGRQIRDGWYFVGGKSYMAKIFHDAGAWYINEQNEESGGVTMDFEAAYAKSATAEFWQTDGAYDGNFTLATLAQEDPRYAEMYAYKQKKVIFCNLTKTPYRELAGVQPHLILADFVKAFHPDILPHYQPTYYKLLTE